MKENTEEEKERKEKKYMKCLYMNKELWKDI